MSRDFPSCCSSMCSSPSCHSHCSCDRWEIHQSSLDFDSITSQGLIGIEEHRSTFQLRINDMEQHNHSQQIAQQHHQCLTESALETLQQQLQALDVGHRNMGSITTACVSESFEPLHKDLQTLSLDSGSVSMGSVAVFSTSGYLSTKEFTQRSNQESHTQQSDFDICHVETGTSSFSIHRPGSPSSFDDVSLSSA